MARDTQNQFGKLWQFRTRRFTVKLILEEDCGYQYDGEDPDGETQAALDCGDYVAFNTKVSVDLDGLEIAADYLGGSVYANTQDFVSEHYGAAGRWGSYFPDMVRTAIKEARDYVLAMPSKPYIRGAA